MPLTKEVITITRKNALEVIMNPIRMRILQTLVTKKKLSSQQISEYLPDVAQATLYRHIHTLVQAGIIRIVHETKKRGTVERIYAVSDDGTILSEVNVDEMSRDEHLQYFFAFLLQLMVDFDAYIQGDHLDIQKDGLTYRQANIYLSDDELQDLMGSISQLLLKHIDNRPTEERTLRSVSSIVISK